MSESTPATEPQYGWTYHYSDAGKSNYRTDLDTLAAGLYGAKETPLLIRLDANWGDIDKGTLVGKVWTPKLNLKKVDDIFTKVLRASDTAIIILSTHSPPSGLKAHLPFQAPAQWRFPDAANNFVEDVVKRIADKGWLDRVAAWQISDEPNNLAFSSVAGWNEIVGPLNTFLLTIGQNDSTNKPRIINMYQTAPSVANLLFRTNPWDEMFATAHDLSIPIGSNFEMMGADIYPDQWVLELISRTEGFQKAVAATIEQLNRAKTDHGFQGTWAILEMAGGPRASLIPGKLTPTPQEIGDCITAAKEANPSMIVPFQVRGSTQSGDLTSFYGHSYGLIDDETNTARADYLSSIQSALQI